MPPYPLWEYKSHLVNTKGAFVGRGKIDVTELDKLLADFGGRGFELVAVVPVSDGSVGTARLLLTFKRPRKVATEAKVAAPRKSPPR